MQGDGITSGGKGFFRRDGGRKHKGKQRKFANPRGEMEGDRKVWPGSNRKNEENPAVSQQKKKLRNHAFCKVDLVPRDRFRII